ncbi:hypothetical protein [Onishia taeanensis]|uniref:hypothetical protein n=1 Tax=Onishia taeanensis TaxID=284577 RepID=UPI000DD3B1C2|nr:hypothetical protein [Halomonas taeanensis]
MTWAIPNAGWPFCMSALNLSLLSWAKLDQYVYMLAGRAMQGLPRGHNLKLWILRIVIKAPLIWS